MHIQGLICAPKVVCARVCASKLVCAPKHLYVCLFVLPKLYVHLFVKKKLNKNLANNTNHMENLDTSELSYTTKLSFTTNTILPGLGVLCTPSVLAGNQVHQVKPAFGLWSFSIVSSPHLDGRALCRLLRVVPHHNSILHQGHYPL